MKTKETSREYYDKLRSYHNREHYFCDRLKNAVSKGYTINTDDSFCDVAIIDLEDYILDNFSDCPIFEYEAYSINTTFHFQDFGDVDFDFSFNTMKEITANDKILFEVEIINDKTHFTAVDYYTALHSDKDIVFVYCKHIVDVECNVVWFYDYIDLD